MPGQVSSGIRIGKEDTMAALVIYESMYGNTARIAEAIGAALGEQFDVELKSLPEVDRIPDGIDVLVVGGPTYGHTVEAAMKTFLDGLPTGSLEGVEAAAFDTRIDWPKLLSGAASKGIADRLAQKGAHIAIDPESFRVEDKDGPLVAGEEQRATAWARQLADVFTATAHQ
jgi:flavodoxin